MLCSVWKRPAALRQRSIAIIGALIVLGSSSLATARPPEIRNINLRGLQIAGTTVVTIDGVDLMPLSKVFLGDQPVDVTVDPQSHTNRVIVSIPLPESTPPGINQLRLATAEGISNSQFVGLDRFPQLPIGEKVAALPVAVHGSVPGSGVSRTTFQGKAGEDVIVEVEARRLASKLRPVIHIYDSRRVQIAWSLPSNTLAGDARAVLKLPRDDVYSVEVHDVQYAPPGPSHFRMKIGQWQFADLAFPPAVTRGQDASVDLLGNVAGLKAPVKLIDATVAPVPWPNPAVAAGLAPTVLATSLTEVVEAPGDQPTPLPGLPIAASGRLTAPGQRDRFSLPVEPGKKLLLEVFSERIGSRIDAVLEIRNDKNALLASNDDGPGTTDPRLEFTVPADQKTIEIIIRDNLDVGGDTAIYRVIALPAETPVKQIDVVVKSESVNVASGEMQVIEAVVNRQAYDGPIQLQVAGLPPGATVQGTEIPAGANGTLVTISNGGETPAPIVTRWRAQSPDGVVAGPVRTETTPDDRLPGWLREQVAIATTPKAAPFQVSVVNESTLTQLVMASKPTLAVKLVRPPANYGPVRLSLVSSQLVPRVNNQPNQNLAVRAEKPVEVPVDNTVKAAGDVLAAIDKQHAEAVKQAQAAQGEAKAAADAKVTELAEKKTASETALREAEAKAAYQVDYAFVVPASLAESSCDISVRAELLNPERNMVLRTVYAPVKRLAVLNPLSIKLAATAPVEATLDPKTGATVKLDAKVERLADYKGDVTVTVAGLPGGVSAANVNVKTDQSDFAIEVKIPPNFAAVEIAGIKLIATGPPDPLSGNIPVKSAEVAATIKVNKPAQ